MGCTDRNDRDQGKGVALSYLLALPLLQKVNADLESESKASENLCGSDLKKKHIRSI